MDIALVVSLAIFTVVFSLIKLHDKKEKVVGKKVNFSISMPLAVSLIVIFIILNWLEYEYLDIEITPHFLERMNELYLLFTITMLQLDEMRRKIKSMA